MFLLENDITTATCLYLGYGKSPHPVHDETAVHARFGPTKTQVLLQKIKSIQDIINSECVDHETCTLGQLADNANVTLKHDFPELGAKAVKALVWDYTFHWR